MRDVKKYLGEIRTLRRRAETLGERLRELRAQATLLTGIDYSKVIVQTSPSDMMSDIMSELADMEKRYRDAIVTYQRAVDERARWIYLIGRAQYEEILERRYLRGQTIEEISRTMNISYERAKHLHGEALEAYRRKVDTK